MIPYRPKKPTAAIEHPGNANVEKGELVVVIERPSPRDREIYGAALAPYQKPVLAINPDTKKPFLDETGKARQMAIDPIYPLAPMIDFLDNLVIDIKGLADEDGKPIAMTAANRKDLLWYLSDPLFRVELPKELPQLDEKGQEKKDADGKPLMHRATLQFAFPFYVLDQMGQEGTFPDPLGRPTKTRSSDAPITN